MTSTGGSWRDEASQVVQDELDELLDVSVRAAQQHLETAGAFYPFAVSLTGPADTTTLTPEVRKGPREVADVAEVLELCWVALAAEAATLRAGAVVSNVGDRDGDAVAVVLEHREGPAIELLMPYAVQGKTNGKKPAQKVLYGDLRAGPGQPRLWPPHDQESGSQTS